MTEHTDKLNIYDLLAEQFGEEKARDLLGIGCDFKNWKTQARKFRSELEEYESQEKIGGILEDQWQTINNDQMSREDFYSLGSSPLEILRECVLGEVVSYPPPEILKVIASQFQHYMLSQGEISLENAFFGDSRGRGVYAKRALSQSQKNQMYEKFKAYSNSQHEKGKSQEHILEDLASISEDPSFESYDYGPQNPFREIANETDDWIDSFLRDYRRWKSATSK